jgi:ubiquinol-cytochrome c reductase cytochrome b subunit
MLIFGVAVFAGLTGFMSQTNWDSQWIALQAKDAMNALGVGAFFNTLDTAQVLTLHVIVLPMAMAVLVGIHLFLIRRDGPVRPLPLKRRPQ